MNSPTPTSLQPLITSWPIRHELVLLATSKAVGFKKFDKIAELCSIHPWIGYSMDPKDCQIALENMLARIRTDLTINELRNDISGQNFLNLTTDLGSRYINILNDEIQQHRNKLSTLKDRKRIIELAGELKKENLKSPSLQSLPTSLTSSLPTSSLLTQPPPVDSDTSFQLHQSLPHINEHQSPPQPALKIRPDLNKSFPTSKPNVKRKVATPLRTKSNKRYNGLDRFRLEDPFTIARKLSMNQSRSAAKDIGLDLSSSLTELSLFESGTTGDASVEIERDQMVEDNVVDEVKMEDDVILKEVDMETVMDPKVDSFETQEQIQIGESHPISPKQPKTVGFESPELQRNADDEDEMGDLEDKETSKMKDEENFHMEDGMMGKLDEEKPINSKTLGDVKTREPNNEEDMEVDETIADPMTLTPRDENQPAGSSEEDKNATMRMEEEKKNTMGMDKVYITRQIKLTKPIEPLIPELEPTEKGMYDKIEDKEDGLIDEDNVEGKKVANENVSDATHSEDKDSDNAILNKDNPEDEVANDYIPDDTYPKDEDKLNGMMQEDSVNGEVIKDDKEGVVVDGVKNDLTNGIHLEDEDKNNEIVTKDNLIGEVINEGKEDVMEGEDSMKDDLVNNMSDVHPEDEGGIDNPITPEVENKENKTTFTVMDKAVQNTTPDETEKIDNVTPKVKDELNTSPNLPSPTEPSSTAHPSPHFIQPTLESLPQSHATTPPTQPQSPTKSSAVAKRWKRLALMVLRDISNHRLAPMFQKPIRENQAPGYSEIVLRPMDLTTLRSRIRDGLITTTEEFTRDVLLTCENAIMFNRHDTEIHAMGKEMMLAVMDNLRTLKAADPMRRSEAEG